MSSWKPSRALRMVLPLWEVLYSKLLSSLFRSSSFKRSMRELSKIRERLSIMRFFERLEK